MNIKLKSVRGITLVALVITIIVLLILAGISIQALTNQGLFAQAKKAKNTTENEQTEENIILGDYENIINKYMSSFDSLNIVDKRLMIKSLVNTIESDGENIYINYMGCP